jgi:DNA-binding NtrC family response regulator
MNTNTPTIPFSGQGRTESNKLRLLIVDDEPTTLFAYQKLFEREGYLVDLCETPEQSMEMIWKRSYHAVISDLRFGGIDNEDGIKLLLYIRKNRPAVKLILVTGNAGGFRKQTCQNLGIEHFYEKPVQPELLLNALQGTT